MPSNLSSAREVWNSAKEISARWRDLLADTREFLDFNSHQAIDWGNNPAYIELDVDGAINGQRFSPANVSNAIGSLATMVAAAESNSVEGNLNQLAQGPTE